MKRRRNKGPFQPGYRVDVVADNGEILAWSPLYTGPPWDDMDEAIRYGTELVEMLDKIGIRAKLSISIRARRLH
jgi:hypothetical protein